jgi:type IV pilus assembly protein PilA
VIRLRSSEDGFTLIEVIVVCAIIAVLSATSLQIFIVLRNRSYDARANSDIRAVAQAEEAYYSASETFKSCASAADCMLTVPGVSALSPGVTLAITATTTGFTGTSSHPKGSGIVYRWDSSRGGMAN